MRRRGTPVSREALYEEVWTDAVTAVAPRYGLSDVGLVKICAIGQHRQSLLLEEFYRHAKTVATTSLSACFVYVYVQCFYRQPSLWPDGKNFRGIRSKISTVRFTVKPKGIPPIDADRPRQTFPMLDNDLAELFDRPR